MKSIPDKKEKVITMSLVESFIAQYKLKFMVKLERFQRFLIPDTQSPPF